MTVAPITSKLPAKAYPHAVLLPPNSLLGEAAVLCNQVRTIAKDRLEGNIGELDADQIAKLDRAVVVALGLPRQGR